MYSQLGNLVAMALVHGGGPLCLFSPSVYRYLCGSDPVDIIVGMDEIGEYEVKNILKQVCVFHCMVLSFL